MTAVTKKGSMSSAPGKSAPKIKARIGILGNDEDDCTSCNSRVGFGTGGENDDSNTCGNHASKKKDINIKAFGYIFVQ